MAKSKQQHDYWIMFVLILLVLVTNLYWMLATRDLSRRLDRQTQDIYTLSSELAKLKQN